MMSSMSSNYRKPAQLRQWGSSPPTVLDGGSHSEGAVCSVQLPRIAKHVIVVVSLGSVFYNESSGNLFCFVKFFKV